jgi:hypothetical protein
MKNFKHSLGLGQSSSSNSNSNSNNMVSNEILKSLQLKQSQIDHEIAQIQNSIDQNNKHNHQHHQHSSHPYTMAHHHHQQQHLINNSTSYANLNHQQSNNSKAFYQSASAASNNHNISFPLAKINTKIASTPFQFMNSGMQSAPILPSGGNSGSSRITSPTHMVSSHGGHHLMQQVNGSKIVSNEFFVHHQGHHDQMNGLMNGGFMDGLAESDPNGTHVNGKMSYASVAAINSNEGI